MTDRGLPIVDGAPACPFVAFEDDRDERASSPDHRHRCYAELNPAPRALAHQEAYCLASAFPVCPTFQDWARREAARARSSAASAVPPPIDEAPRRNPPRDWSAPPPWAGGSGGRPDPTAGATPALVGADDDVSAPDFLSSRSRPERGLAGSAADRLAGAGDEPPAATPRGRIPEEPGQAPVAPAAAAGGRRPPVEPTWSPSAAAGASGLDDEDWEDEDDWEDEGSHSRAADRGRAAATPLGDRRPRVGDTRRRREPEPAPSWERPRRYEAYPTLKTRVGLPLPALSSLPRVGVMALAVVIAAIALFFLPALFVGDDGDPAASPSPSVVGGAPSPSVVPTPTPQPTPVFYTVQEGDTLSRIASRFGVSLADLIEANRETLPNPDVLAIGDRLIIPVPPPEELPGASVDAPSAAP